MSQTRIACACARRNCVQVGPARRGEGRSQLCSGSSRRWTDLVAEPGEFAVDAAVAPGWVLGGQAQDQSTYTGRDSGSTRPVVVGGPAASDELAMPAQDRGGCDQQAEATSCG